MVIYLFYFIWMDIWCPWTIGSAGGVWTYLENIQINMRNMLTDFYKWQLEILRGAFLHSVRLELIIRNNDVREYLTV